MSAMIRKQIYIEPRQERRLKQLVERTGLSEAEVIRQAIDRHSEPVRSLQRNLDLWEAERHFIEGWIAQGAVEGGRIWQREELYER